METTKWIIICLIIFVFSLFLLYFKNIKVIIQTFLLKFKSKKEYKKTKKNDSAKVKKLETQIRPILKPPEEKPKLNPNEEVLKLNPPEENSDLKLLSQDIKSDNLSRGLLIDKSQNTELNSSYLRKINFETPNEIRFNDISQGKLNKTINTRNENNFIKSDFELKSHAQTPFDYKLSGNMPSKKKSQEELDNEFANIKKFLKNNPLPNNINYQNKNNSSLVDGNSYSKDDFRNLSYNRGFVSDFNEGSSFRNNFNKTYLEDKRDIGKFSKDGDVTFDGKSWKSGRDKTNGLLKLENEEISLKNLTSQMKRNLIFSILEKKEWK